MLTPTLKKVIRACRAGMDAKALLSKHAEDVFGVLFPFDKERHGEMNVLVDNLRDFLSGERLLANWLGCPVMHQCRMLIAAACPWRACVATVAASL